MSDTRVTACPAELLPKPAILELTVEEQVVRVCLPGDTGCPGFDCRDWEEEREGADGMWVEVRTATRCPATHRARS